MHFLKPMEKEMKYFLSFSKSLLLLFSFMLFQESISLSSRVPECSQKEDNPECLGSLVAMPLPSSEGTCDGLGSCKLHVLMPEPHEIPEEVQDAPLEKQQMEFRQIFKHTGDLNKQTSSRTRTLMDRLSLVETKVVSVASSLQKLQEESRLNLLRLEEQLNSLVALLLGILSGCKLPCNESVLKSSVLGTQGCDSSSVPISSTLASRNNIFTGQAGVSASSIAYFYAFDKQLPYLFMDKIDTMPSDLRTWTVSKYFPYGFMNFPYGTPPTFFSRFTIRGRIFWEQSLRRETCQK